MGEDEVRSALAARQFVIIVTLARIPLALVFLGLAMRYSPLAAQLMLVIAFLVELSDLADGQLARRCKVASLIGGMLDSGSDQIARATEFVGLAYRGLVPLAIVLLFVCRDAVVMTLRQLADSSGPSGQLGTRPSGKVKGITQGGCIIILCYYLVTSSQLLTFSQAPLWLRCCVWVTALVTLTSLIDYAAAYYRLRHAALG